MGLKCVVCVCGVCVYMYVCVVVCMRMYVFATGALCMYM